jgi:hypothetical protein
MFGSIPTPVRACFGIAKFAAQIPPPPAELMSRNHCAELPTSPPETVSAISSFEKVRVKPISCGRRHSKRYDNTGLFTVTYQLIYRHCTCTV